MPLEKEIETYKANLNAMREYEGKYVLISGATIVDYFTSYDDAIKEGYQKFGLETPFLVRRVETTTHAHFISRMVAPATI